jgi:effector-binding domain-containing protein
MDAPERKQIPEQTVILIQHMGSYADIGAVYHRLRQWAEAHDAKVSGPGFTVFLSPPSELDSASAVFEICLPVEAEPEATSEVTVKTVPAATVAAATVKGPYSEVPGHYSELLAWLSAEGLEPSGPPCEVYIKHPDSAGGGDPAEFVTEIRFPITA